MREGEGTAREGQHLYRQRSSCLPLWTHPLKENPLFPLRWRPVGGGRGSRILRIVNRYRSANRGDRSLCPLADRVFPPVRVIVMDASAQWPSKTLRLEPATFVSRCQIRATVGTTEGSACCSRRVHRARLSSAS